MAGRGRSIDRPDLTFLVDSDWIIDALAGRTSAVEVLAALRDDGLALSTVTIGEVLDGGYGAEDPEATFPVHRYFLDGFFILEVTDPVADTFARLRATLRKQGNLIPDLDLLIAATALVHDLSLLTRNERHFARVPGLRLRRSIEREEPTEEKP